MKSQLSSPPKPTNFGTLAEWKQVAAVTETPLPGIARAIACGNLRFDDLDGERCFTISDSTRRVWQSWHFDGTPTTGNDGDGWAIGLDRAGLASMIVVTLDTGDFLRQHARAASERRADWCAVLIPGNPETLSLAALDAMRGRIVEIPDDAGGGLRARLRNAGCKVEIRPKGDAR